MVKKQSARCLIIGNFGNEDTVFDGQRIKTRITYDTLIESGVFSAVTRLELDKILSHPLITMTRIIIKYFQNDYIIFMVSRRGMQVLYPLLYLLNKITHRRIIQLIIGGGLANRTMRHRNWIRYLSAFEMNCCESPSMAQALKEQGLNNVCIVPNYRPLPSKSHAQGFGQPTRENPHRVCTFSRVSYTKGVETAINVIRQINEELRYTAYDLTIYGGIDAAYANQFSQLREVFPSYIRYGGVLQYDDFAKDIGGFFALLFPTFHPGEGFPGTILDAFACGVPVIASQWHYNQEIISEGITGRTFSLDAPSELHDILIHYNNHPDELLCMREACRAQSVKYTPEVALKPLFELVSHNNEQHSR